jgi:hypothetical protein
MTITTATLDGILDGAAGTGQVIFLVNSELAGVGADEDTSFPSIATDYSSEFTSWTSGYTFTASRTFTWNGSNAWETTL